MKQLEQYPEYKDVKNLRVYKGEQPQGSVIHSSRFEATKTKPQQQEYKGTSPQTVRQPRPQQQEQPLHQKGQSISAIGIDTSVSRLKDNQLAVAFNLYGLKFPINKDGIIAYYRVRNRTTDDLMILLNQLPNKEYQTITEVEKEMSKLFNDKENEYIRSVKVIRESHPGKTIVCRIATVKGKTFEPQRRDLEQKTPNLT